MAFKELPKKPEDPLAFAHVGNNESLDEEYGPIRKVAKHACMSK